MSTRIPRTSSAALLSPTSRLRTETTLEIVDGTFSNKAAHQFIDDCIVPALVEGFLRSRLNLPDLVDTAHNVDQL